MSVLQRRGRRTCTFPHLVFPIGIVRIFLAILKPDLLLPSPLDIPDWNHYVAIRTGCPKTNNITEGWNNRLSHVVGHAHPSFTRFMKCIKMEQRHSESRIALALSGKIKGNVTKKAESRQKALQTLALDYENRDVLDYLRGVSYNVEVSEMAYPEDED